MKKCQNCGTEAGDQAKFCGVCGTPFALAAAEPAAPAPVSPPEAQAPETETVEPPPAEQPPAVETAAPPVYDYAQQAQQPQMQQAPASPTYGYPQQPVAEAAAPPAYDYIQQAQQPQMQQPPAPPTYGYPQQPQQPPAPPTYGYPQQPQQPQAEPAYGYPPQAPLAAEPVKPKKKHRWLIPVIAAFAVAAILLTTFLVFGDRIKGLFAPAEKKWLSAEKGLLTIDGGSIFGTARDSFNQQLEQTKFGGEMEISVDVEGSITPETAAIIDIISKLRLTSSYRVDTNEADPRFQTAIGLGNRDNEADALSLQVYGMDGYIFIDAAPILPKPLVLQPRTVEEMMGTGTSFSALVEGGPAQLLNALKSMSQILSSPEKIGGEVLDIISGHAEKPTVEKGVELTVGGITQKIDKYTVVVKAESAPELIKDVLTYVRDNEEIRDVVNELGAISEKLNPVAPGGTYQNSFSYENFVSSINTAIEQVDKNPENFSIELERELYLDRRGEALGGKLVVWDMRNGKEEVFTLEHVLAEENGSYSFWFSAQPKNQNLILFTSEYTLKDQRYTGTFELSSTYNDIETTLFTGSMENFGLENADGQVYPVGKLVFNTETRVPGLPTVAPVSGINISYDGRIEKESDGAHLMAGISFAMEGQSSGLSAVHVTLDLRTIPEKDVQIEVETPDDYVLLTDGMSLQALIQDDPAIMVRFMQAMSELGIDVSQFMPQLPTIEY